MASDFAFGDNGSDTIDFALEDTVGAASPVASLRLGVLSQATQSAPISARGQWSIATDYQDNPQTVFDRLFGSALDTTDVGTKRNLLRMAANRSALSELEGKLGSYEKARLDQHIAAIDKLNNDILSTPADVIAGCSSPLYNPNGYATEQVKDNFTNLFNLQIENAILALKCSLTQVVSLQFGTHQADFGVTGLTADYHTSIHSGDLNYYASYRTYFSARVAHLIQRLKDEDDGDGGKMIDSTLVVQVTDMADGNAHTAGGADDANGIGGHAPYMFAGGGSTFNRGTVVSVANHHQLLDVVTDYMGVQSSIGLYDASGTASGILV